ncbi:hypothetical protein Abr02nite_61770 [Paractinoplanes brasiliensis]|nr:hypothetical protein Abr02nite_61770 [Actinoplanes brasiliensis]
MIALIESGRKDAGFSIRACMMFSSEFVRGFRAARGFFAAARHIGALASVGGVTEGPGPT